VKTPHSFGLLKKENLNPLPPFLHKRPSSKGKREKGAGTFEPLVFQIAVATREKRFLLPL